VESNGIILANADLCCCYLDSSGNTIHTSWKYYNPSGWGEAEESPTIPTSDLEDPINITLTQPYNSPENTL
jgi:hypothetical protein